jgi:hypothetical protein
MRKAYYALVDVLDEDGPEGCGRATRAAVGAILSLLPAEQRAMTLDFLNQRMRAKLQ